MDETLENPTADLSVLDVVHVVLLLQATMALLAGLAMLLFMGGSPAAWPVALGLPLLLYVAAAGIVRHRRWARKTAVVLQFSLLVGFVIGVLLGLINALDFSVNLLTLITNVAVPIWAIRQLRRPEVLAVFARKPRAPAVTVTTVPAAA